MTRSFYWYQNICPCDLSHLWNWPLLEAFVYHKHILFSFSNIYFIEIILDHLTIMKFNSILLHVSYLNADRVLLYHIVIFKKKTQKLLKISLSLSLSLSLSERMICSKFHHVKNYLLHFNWVRHQASPQCKVPPQLFSQ